MAFAKIDGLCAASAAIRMTRAGFLTGTSRGCYDRYDGYDRYAGVYVQMTAPP